MRTYYKTQRGLTSAPEALVTLSIAGSILTLQAREIPTYLKANGLAEELVRAAQINGVKTGVFPVIEPKTEKAALALSAVIGYPIPVGDGWSFARQSEARKVAVAIKELGVDLDELVMEWQIGRPQGAPASAYQSAQQQLPLGEPDWSDTPF